MPTLRMDVAAGTTAARSWQTPNGDGTFGCGFVAGDPISAVVWAGDSQTTLATPAVAWGGTITANGVTTTYTAATGAPISLWTITLGPNDAAGLAPGVYRLRVLATHGGATGRLWEGLLDVVDSPGSGTVPGLITLTYAESAITRTRLSREERDFLPSLITVASDEVVKWCGQRDFIRQVYTEEYTAELDGRVMLRQMPVNNVTQIRGYPQTILCITGSTASMQRAWVNYTTTGDWYAGTLAFTGLVLNSVSSGVLTTTPILFSGYTTVGQLAAAIGAVPGWTANTQGSFAMNAVSDLQPPGGVVSQGALDEDGVELQGYTEDLTCCRLDNATGALWVGRRRIAGVQGPSWGPEWEILADGGAGGGSGRVQVTYDAGFTIVPSVVQHAVAMVVKGLIEEARHDHSLLSESISGAGSRAYQVAEALVLGLPRPVLYRLSQYRMGRAR